MDLCEFAAVALNIAS